MQPNKLNRFFVIIRNKQVVLDMDAAALYGVEIGNIIKVVSDNLDRFPSDFMIKLTNDEKLQFGTKNASYAFTEAGILMLATILDSDEARNVAFEIIETFTEQQQLLRHIMSVDIDDEKTKKKEEDYMEDKLKQILVRSSACI